MQSQYGVIVVSIVGIVAIFVLTASEGTVVGKAIIPVTQQKLELGDLYCTEYVIYDITGRMQTINVDLDPDRCLFPVETIAECCERLGYEASV